MTLKEIILTVATIVLSKVFNDNVPNLHYKKVIGFIINAGLLIVILGFYLLIKLGIIKFSQKEQLLLVGLGLIILAIKWLEHQSKSNRQASKTQCSCNANARVG